MSSDNEDDEISNSPSVAGVGGGGKTKSDLDRSRSTTPSSSQKEKVCPGFFPSDFPKSKQFYWMLCSNCSKNSSQSEWKSRFSSTFPLQIRWKMLIFGENWPWRNKKPVKEGENKKKKSKQKADESKQRKATKDPRTKMASRTRTEEMTRHRPSRRGARKTRDPGKLTEDPTMQQVWPLT